MNRLAVFDLDGTLLADDGIVKEENISSIKKLVGKGFDVGIISGRPAKFVEEVTKQITENMIQVSYNGSCIKNEYEICISNYKEIISSLKDVHIIIKTQTDIYSNKNIRDTFSYNYFENHEYFNLFTLNNIEVYKIIVIFENNGEYVKNHLDKIECNYFGVDNSGVEIAPKNVSKASALNYLVDKYNYEDVYIFGDGLNDECMFKLGFTNIVMSNASNYIKSYADLVAENEKYVGVSKGLEWIMENDNK
jgi:Cof subfamily protein (haloacid dehalogenase superfamily)